jgi:hypothetical protein
MNIDTMKGDRSKVFRNKRKALNVPVKGYTVYIGLVPIWKIFQAQYPWTGFCSDFKHFLSRDLHFVTIVVHEEMSWEVLQTLSVWGQIYLPAIFISSGHWCDR